MALMGLGQVAQCPSVEQLNGIVDPSDPCQAAPAAAATGACPTGQTCSFFSSIPNTWIYGLAAALGVLMLGAMVGGGGRH
jgi:hypothetical protein